jgi:hypothetical protein
MRRVLIVIALLAAPLLGQQKRVWVLRAPGEMVECDPATFAAKQTVKVPGEAVSAPQSVEVNHAGQILFAPAITLPLAEGDAESAHKAWFWNGRTATTFDLGAKRDVGSAGSNQTITESAPAVYLSGEGQTAEGAHLFWFANQSRRLVREDIDLSATTTWQAWQTDLSGGGREDLGTLKMPDCRCPTGACEDSCPYGIVWVPENGVGKFFLVTQFVAGKTEAFYKASTLYQEGGGKWTATALDTPLRRVLDAASGGNVIVEAIPDKGCCGWSNQSNDQTLVRTAGKIITVFDEQVTYKNSDYDVSFYTSNARLSPEAGYVAMTITATAQANKPIQLAEDGQANPEESKQIHKALADLPAVEVKSMEDSPRRVAFVPHATLVGWISEKELLIVEDHLLVLYNVATGARRKSGVRVEDAAHVFLR